MTLDDSAGNQHTLSTGDRSSAPKWLKFGVQPRMVPDLHSMVVAVWALKNSGKSTVVQSCDDCFLFNLDRKPPSYEFDDGTYGSRAAMWPYVQDGTLYDSVDAKGNLVPIKGHFDWGMVKLRKQWLMDLAAKNEPRPRMIAIDTIDSAWQMLQSYYTKQMVGPTGNAQDVDGRKLYGRVNEEFRNFVLDLNGAGYGIAMLGHLEFDKVVVGDRTARTVDQLTPAVADGFLKAVHGASSVIIELDRTSNPRKDGAGRIIPGEYDSVVTAVVNRVQKSQYDLLPEKFVLPKRDTWQYLVSLFAPKAPQS